MFLSAVVSHGQRPKRFTNQYGYTYTEVWQEQLHGESCESRQIRGHPLPAQFLSMHNKEMFDLENIGKGHGAQHSQWSHSIANINLYKSHTWALFACSHRFRAIHISKFVILKMWKGRSMSWRTTFAVAAIDIKHLTSYLMAIVMFAVFQLFTCHESRFKSFTL